MTLETLLSSTGLGELIEQDFFIAQILLLGGSLLAFVLSLGVCLMAFRAASSARAARSDAEQFHQSAENLAAEVRSLTAQLERRLTSEAVRRADHRTAFAATASEPPSVGEEEGALAEGDRREGAPLQTGETRPVETEPLILGVDPRNADGRLNDEGAAPGPGEASAREDGARANALAFVDVDESVLIEPARSKATGFVGTGAGQSGPAENGTRRERDRPTAALSSLLRRRRS